MGVKTKNPIRFELRIGFFSGPKLRITPQPLGIRIALYSSLVFSQIPEL